MSGPFGPVADYLPHRPPMLLIDRIDEVTADRAVCTTTLHPDCVFAVDGFVHASAMIELVAQVCAIYVGVRGQLDGDPPRLGFIVGCREVDLAVDRFAVGDTLTITARKILGQDQLAAFHGTVSRDGQPCAAIQLSVVDARMLGDALPGAGAAAP
jgi:predicted hotdog family 3-hydroxylacyl-ACP dehydratase